MLAMMLLSQHRFRHAKSVSPRAPCDSQCMGYAIGMWSAICSEMSHSLFGEGARPHFCMDEWNRPTPVRRRLSLAQAVWGKLIPTGLALVLGLKNTEPGCIFVVLRVPSIICSLRSADAEFGKVV